MDKPKHLPKGTLQKALLKVPLNQADLGDFERVSSICWRTFLMSQFVTQGLSWHMPLPLAL